MEFVPNLSQKRFSTIFLTKRAERLHWRVAEYQLLFLIMSVVWQISPSAHSVVMIAAIKAAVIFSGWLALQGYGAAICQMKTRRVGSRIDLQTQPALIWGQCGAEQCSARRDVCKKFEARSIQSQPVVSVNLQMDWAHGVRVPTIWLDLQGGPVFLIHILTPMIIHPFSCVQFLSQQYR